MIRISVPSVCQFFICIYLFKILCNYTTTNVKKNDGSQIYTLNKPEIIIKQQPDNYYTDKKSNIVTTKSDKKSNIITTKSDIDYDTDNDLLDSYLDVNIDDIV